MITTNRRWLSLIFELESKPVSVTVGIESKFTEWLTQKSPGRPSFKEKYFPSGSGVWHQVGLPETQRFAEDIHSKALYFRYLDVAQFAKHALGLATHHGKDFRLFYVYFEGTGREAEIHQSEIALFTERLASELGFRSFSYQELIARLQMCTDVSSDYIGYLNGRYVEPRAE